MTGRKILGVLSVLLVSAAALGGCGSQFRKYCQAEADCEGGNDKDVDACIAQANGAEESASAYDCSDAFSKLADCYERTGNCEKGKYTSNCGSESQALGSCEAAASARK